MGDMLYVREEQTTGTASGSASASTDHVRTLNTSVINTVSGASLSANRITQPAGTYDIHAMAPAFDVTMTRIFLYNITDAAVEILGQTASNFDNGAGTNMSAQSELRERITIADTKVFELRQWTKTAQATNGLGIDASDGRTEVYGQVLVRVPDEAAGGGGGGGSGVSSVEYLSLLLGI